MYGDLGALAWLRYLGDSGDRRTRVRACALHREGVRTPLHPEVFRYQVKQDAELYKERHRAKTRLKRVGKWLDWAWCFTLSTVTIGVVEHHESFHWLVLVVLARILALAVIVAWKTWRDDAW